MRQLAQLVRSLRTTRRTSSTSPGALFRTPPSSATTPCLRRWSIGDWARAGEKWGDKYEAVIEATGLSYNTINNTKTVSKAFDFTRRRVNLSFKHHAEVASLAASNFPDVGKN
jgi:hypothetical protein